MSDKQKKLWKFEWNRYYCICCGLFKATDDEVKSIIGKEIDLGEIEGKYGYVYGIVDEEDITFISDNPVVVNAVPEIGINPLAYIEEEMIDDEMD